MIKINLLGDDTVRDYSKELQIGAFFGSIVVLVLICLYVSSSISNSIEDMESKKAALEGELKRLEAVTKEVKDLEAKQKDLRDRLVRIATLKRSKLGPVKVLQALNEAIPERAWFSEVREKEGVLNLKGLAIDGETMSTLMRELEKSEHFPKVELDVAKQAIKQGVKIQEFVIRTDVSYGGRIPIIEAGKENVKEGSKK